MKTKTEIIAEFKAQYPTLRLGDDEQGYTDMTPAQYTATIAGWADNVMAENARIEAKAQTAADKAALLAKLGISADEAKLLLS